MKERMFTIAVKALDDYNKALAMGFPEGEIAERWDFAEAMLEIIDNNGYTQEFNDFAGVA